MQAGIFITDRAIVADPGGTGNELYFPATFYAPPFSVPVLGLPVG